LTVLDMSRFGLLERVSRCARDGVTVVTGTVTGSGRLLSLPRLSSCVRSSASRTAQAIIAEISVDVSVFAPPQPERQTRRLVAQLEALGHTVT